MQAFLTDSGPLVALLDRSDSDHEWAREQFAHVPYPVWTCEGAIVEASHLLASAGLPAWGDGLLVDYVDRRRAQVIVRGLRAVSDFEFEFQMALMNQRLNGRIETIFLMPAEQYTYTSSRLIKEVFRLGGKVHGLVPDMVEDRLRHKLAARSPLIPHD